MDPVNFTRLIQALVDYDNGAKQISDLIEEVRACVISRKGTKEGREDIKEGRKCIKEGHQGRIPRKDIKEGYQGRILRMDVKEGY